jgi:hypothetical protein
MNWEERIPDDDEAITTFGPAGAFNIAIIFDVNSFFSRAFWNQVSSGFIRSSGRNILLLI